MKIKLLVYILLLAALQTACTKKEETPPQSNLHVMVDFGKLKLPSGANPELSNIKLSMYKASYTWREGFVFHLEQIPATVTVTKGLYSNVTLEATISYKDNGNTTTLEASASMSEKGGTSNFIQDDFTNTFELEKKK